MTVLFHTEKSTTAVECMRSLNLLGHAQVEEIDLGSRCGGYGECGGDKVQIRAGREFLTPVTACERDHLTEEEIQRGMRLGCQAFPLDNHSRVEVQVRASS